MLVSLRLENPVDWVVNRTYASRADAMAKLENPVDWVVNRTSETMGRIANWA